MSNKFPDVFYVIEENGRYRVRTEKPDAIDSVKYGRADILAEAVDAAYKRGRKEMKAEIVKWLRTSPESDIQSIADMIKTEF